MQIEAIYENGRLVLPEHVRLKHPRVRVTVVVPDEALEDGEHVESSQPPDRPSSPRGSILDEINAILGPWQDHIRSGPPLTCEDLDQLRYEALKDKYLGDR